MRKVQALYGCIRPSAVVIDVGKTKPHYIPPERPGGIELRRRKNGVTQALIACHETRHSHRRIKTREVGAHAPDHLMPIAGGVEKPTHVLKLTRCQLSRRASLVTFCMMAAVSPPANTSNWLCRSVKP